MVMISLICVWVEYGNDYTIRLHVCLQLLVIGLRDTEATTYYKAT